MISAFGVEHGVVSKGLPSAVRNKGWGRTAYVRNLMDAKRSGKTSAFMRAQARKHPVSQELSEMAAEDTARAGQAAKRQARYEINEAGNFYRSGKRRRLP